MATLKAWLSALAVFLLTVLSLGGYAWHLSKERAREAARAKRAEAKLKLHDAFVESDKEHAAREAALQKAANDTLVSLDKKRGEARKTRDSRLEKAVAGDDVVAWLNRMFGGK